MLRRAPELPATAPNFEETLATEVITEASVDVVEVGAGVMTVEIEAANQKETIETDEIIGDHHHNFEMTDHMNDTETEGHLHLRVGVAHRISLVVGKIQSLIVHDAAHEMDRYLVACQQSVQTQTQIRGFSLEVEVVVDAEEAFTMITRGL